MFKFIKNIFDIISKKDRKRMIVIFFMILISSALDLVGVSAIIPIVSLLSAPDAETAIAGTFLLKALSTLFNTSNTIQLSIIAMVSILIIFFIKVLYSFLMTFVNSKFLLSFNRRLRTRLMKIYLSMPYEYHHENNSSTLIRKSTYDVDMFCSAVDDFLSFSVKLTTAIAIVIYLFVFSFVATLIIGSLLSLFALFIILVLRKKNRRLGIKIQELNSYNYKYLSQSFNGIKESKISNSESFFISQYESNILQINKYSIRRTMYRSVPGHTLEFVGIVGLIISLLIIVLNGGQENFQIVSTIAVFAYAVIKLLPCITEISSYFNNYAFNSASVNTIHKDLSNISVLESQLEEYNQYKKMNFNSKIEVDKVSFSYKDDPNNYIIKNVSFTINKNTSIAISGISGAGKTTLVDIILGLLKPVKGYVYCDGNNINENVRGWRDNLSYVPQNIYLMDDTIRNNIAFGVKKELINDKDVWSALEKAQLKEFVEQSPKGLDTIIGERGIRLSGGQRQRIGIARAFYRGTNIIVLDEATSALDYDTEKNILDHISQFASDHTLIIITHRLNTIQSCDYIYKINSGTIECIKSI